MNVREQNNAHVVLVTGAHQGIGFEVCRQLARRDWTVILTSRELTKAKEAAKQLVDEGLDVHAHCLDVTQDASVREVAQELDKTFGRLDVLINNAAAYVDWAEKVSTADLNGAHTVLETNLFGAWRTTQLMLPLLRKSQHGRIVFVSSGAGSHGDQQFGLTTNAGSVASYGISKAAVNALMTKFASELEGTSILVNAVCPGLTATAPGMEAMGARPVTEGAASVLWAALLPDDGPNGGFFRDGKPLPW